MYDQPEVIIFGLPADTAQTILNDICEHAARGERFFAGDSTDKFLQAHDVCFTEVPPEAYANHFGFALWFYRSLPERLPAIQLAWPDSAGKFPWDPGSDRRLDRLQPVLSSIS